MFGIPNEVIASVVTAVALILARRLGVKLPLDTHPPAPDATPVDPANPPVPPAPVQPDLETLVERIVLSLVNKLFKREELPPGPRAQVELLVQELSKKA